MKIDVEVTWGDGPNMIVILREKLYPHKGAEGSFDLSLKEAKMLVANLKMKIKDVEQIEDMCTRYDKL